MRTAVSRRRGLAASLLLALAAGPAGAASVYQESVSGDLSDDQNAPTALAFSAGSNVVTGSVQGTPTFDDDFFAFTIAAGFQLDAIVLVSHAPSVSTSFLGLHLGPTFTSLSNASMLGHALFDSGDAATDLLPAMAASNGNFTPPLGAGTYSGWFAEGGSLEAYSVDFQVSAVPEPASAALVGLGLAALAGARRRR